jgi:HAD superfamily hydrolase (TIGR01509 family)
MGRFDAVLVDVGGTLVPDSRPDSPELVQARLARLGAVFPELDPGVVERLLDDLAADGKAGQRVLDQRTDATIAARLAMVGPGLSGRAGEVRRALSRPTGHEHAPFPGYRELLVAARDLGLRRVLVTNTWWTSVADWWQWRVGELGLDGLVDGIVTSYDVGFRKPHPAMFERAIALAGCPAERCVMIGDSEMADVGPAVALGMTVIRVAIQAPPTPTRAQHLVTDLEAARQVLVALATE